MSLSQPTIKAAIIDVLSQSFDENTSAATLRDQFADALSDVIIEAIQSATLTIPAGTIVTTGSAATQTQSIPGVVNNGLT
jgi:hypothetical protein